MTKMMTADVTLTERAIRAGVAFVEIAVASAFQAKNAGSMPTADGGETGRDFRLCDIL